MATASYKDLIVWQKAMQLVKQLYLVSRQFPREETYGITAQLRRAGVSIPANIAEGNARSSKRDYAHFLAIARGSLTETETLLLIALQLGYVEKDAATPVFSRMDEIGRMLRAMHSKLSVA